MQRYFFLLPFCFLLSLHSLSAQDEDFDLIAQRVFNEYQKSPNTETLDKNAAEYLSKMAQDGSWPDIDYSSKSMSGWQPNRHIQRIGGLVKAYSRPKSNYYQNRNIHSKIIRSIKFWFSLSPEPSSDNWWWTSISVPQEIGQFLIALRTMAPGGISKEYETNMIKWMNKYVSIYKTPGKDGSNLTDIAQHMIFQAVLTKDADLLHEAVDVTSKSIKISSGEGIQRDFSFHAHGPELYIHGYGREYLSGIRNVAVYVKGTQFEFSKEQIALISDFMRKGYLNVIRGRYVDYAVIGRGIARKNNTRTNSGIVKQIRDIDIPEHREEYNQAIARIDGKAEPNAGIQPSNTSYWRSDYMVHHRPEFMVSVNAASARSIRTESGNGENLTGQWLTEGAMFIAMKGNEYYNIFPNWQWSKIPGTTTPEINELKKRTNWVAVKGKSDFVGSVSDGLNGLMVYKMNDYGMLAHKSWFFMDDLVVCLGAGISADRSEKITTSINQVRLRGAVWAAQVGDFTEIKESSKSFPSGLSWVYHDGVGYYFPSNQNVTLSAREQEGSWSEINANSSKSRDKLGIFQLHINHQQKPKNESYAYILTPGVADWKEAKAKPVDQIEILSNTPGIQAVKDSRSDLIGFVFYEKGKVEWEGNSLSVNKPALVQVQKVGSKWNIHLSEPTQSLTGTIQVELRIAGKNTKLDFKLPEGDLAGSTISKTVEG